MPVLETAAFLIVATYVAARLHLEGRRGGETGGRARLIVRLLVTAAAAWVCEETCIRLYGFYAYSPDWSIAVGSVPFMVVIIWPVVIHSGADLARRLCGPTGWAPLAAGAIVFTDAALIEPVAVKAGLWHWTEPGLFSVPPVGILGWAFFAALCAMVFAANDGRGRRLSFDLAALPIALAGCHALLLAAWWLALRWVNFTLPPWPCAAAAWAVGIYLTHRAWRTRAGGRVGIIPLLVRIPAALFFMVLLFLHCRAAPSLVVYVLAFVPPYLALTFSSVGPDRCGRTCSTRRRRPDTA